VRGCTCGESDCAVSSRSMRTLLVPCSALCFTPVVVRSTLRASDLREQSMAYYGGNA